MKYPRYVHYYKDRQGRDRIYYRRAGQPQVPLRGPVSSKAFWEDYQLAVTGQKPKAPVGASRSKSGTFNDLITRYYKSPSFVTLADSTKNTYRGQIEQFRKEYGDNPVSACGFRKFLDSDFTKSRTLISLNTGQRFQ